MAKKRMTVAIEVELDAADLGTAFGDPLASAGTVVAADGRAAWRVRTDDAPAAAGGEAPSETSLLLALLRSSR